LADAGDPFHLIDPVLTAVATIATIDAGMWRLNGTPVRGMSFLYHNFFLCPSLKRHDLVAIQGVICAVDEPARIAVALLERFNLEDWADKKLEKPWKKNAQDEEETMKTNRRAEAFLLLVLAVCLERRAPGVGRVSDREELRHRIVQLLCAEAMAHSKVMRALEVSEEEVAVVDEELQLVAVPEGPPGKRFYKVKKGKKTHNFIHSLLQRPMFQSICVSSIRSTTSTTQNTPPRPWTGS